jgi:hypothetical protein
MNAVLAALGAVLALVLLWIGVKRLRFTTAVAAALSAVDLRALALTLVPLGWWVLRW